jgi:indoleamine 2,3-dioxygenase
LRGVEALELMQATMDEMFVGDAIAVRRITAYLLRIAVVIQELKALLLALRESCDSEVFYQQVRPWLRGADSDLNRRKWVFEGLDAYPDLHEPTELSGPSAGQSALIHALDIFLGVDAHESISPTTSASSSSSSSSSGPSRPTDGSSFLSRMQLYMPRHHRAFLSNLSATQRPLRGLVLSSSDPKLTEAYNAAILSLKEFRDAHMIIITLYILGPARRLRREAMKLGQAEGGKEPLKGTGGTDLVQFLKGVRDITKNALIPDIR